MYKLLVFCFLLPVFARCDIHKYYISFTDKDSSAYSVSNPSAFLSQRAITRRSSQGISITPQDFPVNANYVDSLASMGATILTRSKWFNGVSIECDSSLLPDILSLQFVQSSKKILFPSSNHTPKELTPILPQNDKSFLRTSFDDYGNSFNQIHIMNGEFLHDAGFRGEGMLIAILDAGFFSVDQLAPFASLRNQNHIVATWDFVAGDSSVYDDDTHGMQVLSSIAGNVTGELLGTAPNASFLLLRSEDVFSENIIEEYNWDAAAEYADSAGADVITSSLGYTQFDDPADNHSYNDMDGDHCPSSIAADIAVAKGILVLTSAGNSGIDPWHYISAPSDGDSVISVGAVDSAGLHIFFSSWGPGPNGEIKPNVDAMGFMCTLADAGGGVTQGSGTSFACPILAGSATCLWQMHPSLNAMEIKSAIERSANCYAAPNDSMGYGIPDFRLANFYLSTGGEVLPVQDFVIDVYPNPFNENLNVRFFSTKSQTVKLEMINSLGQVIIDRYENSIGWDINIFTISNANLATGIYFLRLSTESENFIYKIIKD